MEGVRVFLAGLDGRSPDQLVTDARGRVEFRGVTAGRKAISTDRGGTVLLEVVGGADSDQDLILPTGHAPRVRAVGRDGLGIPEASVFVSFQSDVPWGTIVARTDAHGWCTLSDIETGRWVWLEAKGYLPSYAQPVSDSADRIVVLEEGGFELCGSVVDGRTDEGLQGTVTLEGYRTAGSVVGPDGTTRVLLPPPPRSVESDAAGGFCLQVSDYAGLSLRVESPGHASREIALTPEILRSRSLRIGLDAATPLAGVVRNESGEPIPGCMVRALFTDGRRSERIQTERDGHFLLRDAPLGEAWVEALGPDGYAGRSKALIGDGTRVEILCTAEDAVVVEVLAPGRIPLADCTLAIVERHSGDARFQRTLRLGTANAEGILRVRADRLYDGCFIAAFSNGSDTFPVHKQRWTHGTSRLEILLPHPPQVGELRVRLENHDSRDGLSVFLRSEQEQTLVGRGVDPDGCCAFEGLPAGTYLVLVCAGNVEFRVGLREVYDGGDPWLRLDARRLDELERSNFLGLGVR